jgi:hypothetical protein
MKFYLLLCLMFSVIFITGCSTRLGDFTVISSKNVDLSNFSTQVGLGSTRVRGEDEGHIIIIFRTKVPTIKDAIDVALDENNAYMLSDAVLKHESFTIPLIYGSRKYVVEGHPVLRKNN